MQLLKKKHNYEEIFSLILLSIILPMIITPVDSNILQIAGRNPKELKIPN